MNEIPFDTTMQKRVVKKIQRFSLPVNMVDENFPILFYWGFRELHP